MTADPQQPAAARAAAAATAAGPKEAQEEPDAAGDGPALSIDELTTRIRALPRVEFVIAGEGSGAPASMWGARFFFVGPGRMMPFATIVENDTPGWDEESRLSRPGVYRLNISLGRDAFTAAFGYPPSALDDHRAAIDFGALGELMPHPVYGGQAWVCVLNPASRLLSRIDELLAHAHERATRRG